MQTYSRPKRNSLKVLQQHLSLPTIPEQPTQFPKTSQNKKSKHMKSMFIPISPEEQQANNPKKSAFVYEQKQNHQSNQSRRSDKRQRVLLPKISNNNKNDTQLTAVAVKKNATQKMTLDSILRNQHDFVNHYFKQINAKLRQ